MSEAHSEEGRTVSVRVMDMVVALAFMAAAGVVMWDSWSIGARWVDGPQAGYFPFYIGLFMFIASVGTLLTSLLTKTPNTKNFVGRGQFWSVLQVLVPAAIFVALIPFLGLYVAGAIFIAFFMAWLGKYGPVTILPVAIGVPVLLFFMFEIWFLVPLPKGPIENMLGF